MARDLTAEYLDLYKRLEQAIKDKYHLEGNDVGAVTWLIKKRARRAGHEAGAHVLQGGA